MSWSAVRRALLLALVAAVGIRMGGILARMERDRQLRRLITTGLTALNGADQASGLVAFIDRSTLLGQWREGGIFYDEEDADLAVVVPPSMGAEDVARILRNATAAEKTLRVIEEPGMVYLEPHYNRLHLDMYLMRMRSTPRGGKTRGVPSDNGENVTDTLGAAERSVEYTLLDPMWPQPKINNSHAAFVHPRPFCGVRELNGWSAPANAGLYLQSLYGYTGTPAVYNPAKGLYEKHDPAVHGTKTIGLAQQLMEWAYRSLHLLSRDAYFMVIMTPMSQEFRKGVEAQYEGAAQAIINWWCPGSNFRDCF